MSYVHVSYFIVPDQPPRQYTLYATPFKETSLKHRQISRTLLIYFHFFISYIWIQLYIQNWFLIHVFFIERLYVFLLHSGNIFIQEEFKYKKIIVNLVSFY